MREAANLTLHEITNIFTLFNKDFPLWALLGALVVTAAAFLISSALTHLLFWKKKKQGRLLDTLLLIPMALPPMLTGAAVLFVKETGVFGLLPASSAAAGTAAPASGRYGAVFANPYAGWALCLLCAFITAFPVIFRCFRSALEKVDEHKVITARTLGMGKGSVFRNVIFPEAKGGILAGMVMTFFRSLGEYAATWILFAMRDAQLTAAAAPGPVQAAPLAAAAASGPLQAVQLTQTLLGIVFGGVYVAILAVCAVLLLAGYILVRIGAVIAEKRKIGKRKKHK